MRFWLLARATPQDLVHGDIEDVSKPEKHRWMSTRAADLVRRDHALNNAQRLSHLDLRESSGFAQLCNARTNRRVECTVILGQGASRHGGADSRHGVLCFEATH